MARMETLNIDIRPHIAAVAQPGDTVLIGFNHVLTDDEYEALREQFEGFLDTTKVHLAFLDQVASMVVIKGDDEDEYDKEFPE